MRPRKAQIKKAMEEILLEELKNNTIPNANELTNLMYDYFNQNPPGKPTFKGIEVDKKSKTDFEEYTKALDAIEFDLDTLFKSGISQMEKLLNRFVENKMQHGKIIKDMKKVNNKSNDLLSKVKGYSNINEKYNLQFLSANDFKQNSSAYIDLKDNNLKLKPNLYKSHKASINNINLESISNEDKITISHIHDINNAKNDYSNQSWMLKTKPKKDFTDELTAQHVALLVELKEERNINRINLSSNTREKSLVTIKYSQNEEDDFNSIQSTRNKNYLEDNINIYFEPIKAKYFYIILTKEYTENEDKEFIFSLSDISLYKTMYEHEGKTITEEKSISDEHTIDKVSLEADEMLPEQTNAYYYLEADDSKYNFVPKDRADNNEEKFVNFNSTEVNNLDMSNKKEKEFVDHLSLYGKGFYSINDKHNKIPNNIVKSETKVFKGINQWHKQVYQFHRDENHRVSISDWTNPPVKKSEIINNYSKNTKGEYLVRQYINIKEGKDYYPLQFFYVPYFQDITLKKIEGNTIKEVSDYTVISPELYDELPESYGRMAYREGREVQDAYVDGYATYLFGEEIKLGTIHKNLESTYIITNISAKPGDIVFAEYPARFLNYKFTTYIKSEEGQDFQTKPIKLKPEIHEDIFEKDAFYMNNNRLPRIEQEDGHVFRGYLQEGWNRIDYLCYIDSLYEIENDMGFLSDNILQFIDIDDLYNVTNDYKIEYKNRRAHLNSLNKINMYDLQHTVSEDDNLKYSLEGYSDGYDAIVNSPEMANYKIKYRKILNQINDYKLRIKLETDNPYYTPEIEDVTLNFSYSKEDD